MSESSLALTILLGLGLPFVFALIWHALIRRYLLASIVTGVTTGAMFVAYYSWRSQFGLLELVTFFLVGVVLGFIFASGVGIPFHRRRVGHGLGEN